MCRVKINNCKWTKNCRKGNCIVIMLLKSLISTTPVRFTSNGRLCCGNSRCLERRTCSRRNRIWRAHRQRCQTRIHQHMDKPDVCEITKWWKLKVTRGLNNVFKFCLEQYALALYNTTLLKTHVSFITSMVSLILKSSEFLITQ